MDRHNKTDSINLIHLVYERKFQRYIKDSHRSKHKPLSSQHS